MPLKALEIKQFCIPKCVLTATVQIIWAQHQESVGGKETDGEDNTGLPDQVVVRIIRSILLQE